MLTVVLDATLPPSMDCTTTPRPMERSVNPIQVVLQGQFSDLFAHGLTYHS